VRAQRENSLRPRRRSWPAVLPAAVLAATLTYGVVAPGSAQARPQYARQTGLPCGQCHVNPAGGGPRNAFGQAFAANGHRLPGEAQRREVFGGQTDERSGATGGYGGGMMGGYGMGMMGGGNMMFGGIGMLLFWGVVIAVLVFLWRNFFGPVSESRFQMRDPGSTSLETLRKRYAKGEITRDEFEEAKRTLQE